MSQIEIYSSPLCPYCHRAKGLLRKKGVSFTEINVLRHPERRQEMIDRARGRTTVPQIFILDRHIGGCDELFALEKKGGLDTLLQQIAA